MTDQPVTLEDIGLDHFAPYLMNRIIGRYNQNQTDRLREVGMTTPKMRVLAILSVRDSIRINELAIHAVSEQSTLSRTIANMVQEGLVVSETDEGDNRARSLRMTDKGRGLFDSFWPTMLECSEDLFTNIDGDERDAFIATLRKILNTIKKHDV